MKLHGMESNILVHNIIEFDLQIYIIQSMRYNEVNKMHASKATKLRELTA